MGFRDLEGLGFRVQGSIGFRVEGCIGSRVSGTPVVLDYTLNSSRVLGFALNSKP